MAAPMEVSLPQTMLQKLLDLLKLESLKFCLKIHVHVIHKIHCQVNNDYHNQHESAALIGLFYATSLVLPSVERYPNYRKPTQRGVQGYLSSLQRSVVYKLFPSLVSISSLYIIFYSNIKQTNSTFSYCRQICAGSFIRSNFQRWNHSIMNQKM